MIQPIQIILSVGILLLTVIVFIKIPNRRYLKLLFLALACVGLIIIYFPDFSTKVANVLGVGRGADLIMYLGFINILTLNLLLYIKYRALKGKFTELTREIAIMKFKKQ